MQLLKQISYVASLRELLENLGAEITPDGLPRISKAKVNDYSEKIEALAAKLAAQPPSVPASLEAVEGAQVEEVLSRTEEVGSHISPGLRKRRYGLHKKVEAATHEITEGDPTMPVKLDALAQAHIEKHRKLQEDLTDEMVGLAQQLKESSLLMNQSLEGTEKILDSTERAVEHSLASTGYANTRAMEIYSETFKTTCFTWLIIFFMTCIFVMVVLLIRVT
ncbi:uncharacterized protein LOC143876542 isoform X2 [Tasmannia lanceolata]|uniref:uncharacterized protein LOC143876542 isoform X2 n=1 Tax=Tasmannia lanceolata TaxID=3420 RepID=UPI00406392A5